jgi:diacylglycerol kinase (ATP)
MKFVKLLHNPSAGDGDHTVEELVSIIESAGFECSHDSTKTIKNQEIDTRNVDIVALAGGDGTIRKVAKKLLEEHVPIGLFPKGTANNIAKTLGIPDDPAAIVSGWKKNKVKPFDIGRISGMEEETFFLEGFGYGVFPLLMDAMKSEEKKIDDDPEAKLHTALEFLHDIVSIAAAVKCDVTVDGKDYSGNFLLAEVMNTRSIGPNLNLSPLGDPGDGIFEVVLISEANRDKFLNYLESKVEGEEKLTFFTMLKGKQIRIFWHGTNLHIDDERIKLKEPCEVEINLEASAFNFLVS